MQHVFPFSFGIDQRPDKQREEQKEEEDSSAVEWQAKAVDKKNWKQAKHLLKQHFAYSKTNIQGYKTLFYYLRSRYFN